MSRAGAPDPRGDWRDDPRSRSWTLSIVVLTLALLTVACGSGSKSTGSGVSQAKRQVGSGAFKPVGARIKGGTVTWAQGPQSPPTYIFPLANAQTFSVTNLSQFQALMYRPLYWFGNDNRATINYDYSLASKPVFSDQNRKITIKLNNRYSWSDGEKLTSANVLFFMDLLIANPTKFGAYAPGLLPDNVASVSAPDATSVVFELKKSYNSTWFLYNQLSEITPLPLAWDRTSLSAPVPRSYSRPTKSQARAVYEFLDAQAKNTSKWASSPLWSVVDGPWKLRSFSNTGEADFVPNPTYGGPSKPTISEFKELPFTGEQAELNVAKTGPDNLTIGWIPAANLPQSSSVKKEGYKVFNAFNFSYNFFPLNLNNPKFGKVFQQLYFRQAFQMLVNQPGWIHAFFNGAAIATEGPIPINPTNAFNDKLDSTGLYHFDIRAAKKLLTAHGWAIEGGSAVCRRPGSGATHCGAGVPAGLSLSFNLDYQAGPVALDQEMRDLKSNAAQVGINLQLTTHPFASVISTATQCTPKQPTCKWTAQNWGGGWVYSPDFYPSGEVLFQTHAVANFENWSDPTADRLIAASTTGSDQVAQANLSKYQDYVIRQVPVVWLPNIAGNPVPGGSTIVSEHLGGFSTNAYSYITPEKYYLTR